MLKFAVSQGLAWPVAEIVIPLVCTSMAKPPARPLPPLPPCLRRRQVCRRSGETGSWLSRAHCALKVQPPSTRLPFRADMVSMVSSQLMLCQRHASGSRQVAFVWEMRRPPRRQPPRYFGICFRPVCFQLRCLLVVGRPGGSDVSTALAKAVFEHITAMHT